MAERKYKIGQRINGILLLRDGTKNKYRKGVFECPFCKQEFETRISHVVDGGSTSCGCMFNGKPKHYQTTLAGYRSPTYKTWTCMMGRCYGNDPKDIKSYKEKGVIVCERWHNFNNFLADVGERPEGKTADRFPNKDGNYELINFRWATPKEQTRNLNNNLRVEYNGQEKTLAEWCEELNLNYFRIRERIFRQGVPIEMAFTEPKRSGKICALLKEKRELTPS